MILFGFVLYTIAFWSLILSYGSDPRGRIAGVPWWLYLPVVSAVFAALLILITAKGMKEEPLDPWIRV